MERYGRPRFQGSAAASKPYGNRPRSSQTQSGQMLGSSSRQSSDQYGSYQTSKPNQRSNIAPGSVLAGTRSLGSRSSAASGSQQETVGVPSEVRHLMQTLGLSQSDMHKLSQLPEKDLSVGNLAKAIGNLKQGKQGGGARSGSFSSTPNPVKRSESFQRGREESRGGYRNDEGTHSNQSSGPRGFQGRAGLGQRSPTGNRSFGNSGNRHATSLKATVKSTPQPLMSLPRSRLSDPISGSGFSDRRDFSEQAQRDEYEDEQRLYSRRRSAEQAPQPRNTSYTSQSSRRSNEANFSAREAHAKPVQYGSDRRVIRDREPQGRGTQPHRPVGTRNVSKGTVASTLPSLLDMPLSQKSRNTGSGLLGNAPQSRPQGLDNIIAAVGGESLLTPLMLATQSDPSVLEAQIQAMKVLQAQAIKLQSGGRERDRPVRRSPPPSRASLIERRMHESARKEAQAMRSARGRVLYIKYKSPRILEKDLRQLASAFGRVSKLFIIKPKIKNGHFQAFMEMDSWDCAAAMLEHFIARPPNIKGFPVDVQRSNYGDLQPKLDQKYSGKRRRSMSPIRKGTTQLPSKRERKNDDKPSLSITTSRSERRIVSQSDDKDNKKPKTQDKKKTDAREILNRKSAGRKASEASAAQAKKEDQPSETEDEKQTEQENGEAELSPVDSKKEVDAEKSKDDFDPLDALADELALHDEFVLMDEVGYDGARKKTEEDDKKEGVMELDETELDLEDVKVEVSQEDREMAEKVRQLLNATPTVEDIVGSVMEEVLEVVMHQIENTGQADLEEEMAALQEFNASEDEVHEYVYPEESQSEEDPVEEFDETEESLEESAANENEVKNQLVLKEILEAKDHLDALVKVTKAKAAQACAKKLRVCLEVAISHLEGGDGE